MLATFVLFGEKGVNSFREMSPNEVGDLFAGIAGPLAFIWLVYGYLLQGISMRQHAKEIAQSAMALSMQAVQMEAQKKRRAIAIAPNFQLRSLGGDPISETAHEARFEIENINEGARKIQIHFEGNRYQAEPSQIDELMRGTCRNMKFSFNSNASAPISFSVNYVDIDGNYGVCRFQMEIQRYHGPGISCFDFKPIRD